MSTEEKLAPNCKMRSGRRYASDEDCAACGLGEGSACATYERLAAARVAALRASAPPRPEPGIKAIAWEIASFLGVTPWAVDNGGVEAWERYKPLAETVMALALSAEVQELRAERDMAERAAAEAAIPLEALMMAGQGYLSDAVWDEVRNGVGHVRSMLAARAKRRAAHSGETGRAAEGRQA